MSVKTDTTEKKENLQPSDLNQYIHLTSVSLWIVLGAALIFVIGLIVWGFTAKLLVTVDTVAVSDSRQVEVYIPEDEFSKIKEDSELDVADVKVSFGTVPADSVPVPAGTVLDEYQRSLAGLDADENVYVISRDLSVPAGSYDASVVLEQIRPYEFLFGGESGE